MTAFVPLPPAQIAGECDPMRKLRKKLEIAHHRNVPFDKLKVEVESGGEKYAGTLYDLVELWLDGAITPIPQSVQEVNTSVERAIRRYGRA